MNHSLIRYDEEDLKYVHIELAHNFSEHGLL